MRGNGTRPVNSIGVYPAQFCNGSSIGCGKRDRLLTHSTASSLYSRRYASTDGLEPPSSRKVPTAKDSCRRRTASMVRLQLSTEVGLSFCASTLMAWYPYTGSWFTGRDSRPAGGEEKPAVRSGVHRIRGRPPAPAARPEVVPPA